MHRIASLALVVTLLLAACSATPTADTNGSEPTLPGSAAAADTVAVSTDEATLDARINTLSIELLAMSPDEQQTYLAAMASDFELGLAKLSGLEDALGGPDPTATALRGAWGPLIEEVRSAVATPIPHGFRSAAAAPGPNLGEGLFGSMVFIFLGAEAVVSASNTESVGEPGIPADLGNGMKISATPDAAVLDFEASHTSDGVTTKLKVHIEVLPCPGPDGRFQAKARADISATAGSVGQTGILDVTLDGQIDDDARLVSKNVDFRMQWADFAGGKGQFVDMSGGFTGDSFNGLTVNRTGGAATTEFASAATVMGALFGLMIAGKLAEAAQIGWESGRCVRLDTTAAPGPTGMTPSSTSTITASPRSKIDGAKAGGTVKATLVSGGKGVDPAATKVAADATFTYSAPDEKDKTGTVALEARSRRGVGKAEITFDTKGRKYAATYDDGEISIRGTVADLAAPFDATGTVTGGVVVFHFVPLNADGGSVSHDDQCGPGCVAKGTGTYTIDDTDAGDGTLTLNMGIHTCVTVTADGRKQEICDDKQHAVLLTPA